ncbi:MAG: hypothetical protein ACKVQQ_10630 [Burkholderiales bacterium]
MKFEPRDPPRAFSVGQDGRLVMLDCGVVHLAADEQVTFVTVKGAQYDVSRKEWGFYATPSLNGRLSGFGLRTCLACNSQGRYFVLLVERGHEAAFEQYAAFEALRVVAWLDDADALAAIERGMRIGTGEG